MRVVKDWPLNLRYASTCLVLRGQSGAITALAMPLVTEEIKYVDIDNSRLTNSISFLETVAKIFFRFFWNRYADVPVFLAMSMMMVAAVHKPYLVFATLERAALGLHGVISVIVMQPAAVEPHLDQETVLCFQMQIPVNILKCSIN